tara:strand:- start:633 stop:1073 length:441 start_codon:yes stop_codon:yes gene_type:complete
MPVICVNPSDELDVKLLESLNEQNQDVRVFISDGTPKKILEQFLGKKANGDLKDDSHISTASSGAYCGIFLESDHKEQRTTFVEAIKNSSLKRILWASPFEPSEEVTSVSNLVYIFYHEKYEALKVILDYEGRNEVKSQIIDLVNK